MSIEILTEQLIAVREVPRLLPSRPNGRKIHVSTVYRWIQRGVRGVRLEATRIGGTTYTSREALERFASRLMTPESDPAGMPPAPRQRLRQLDQVRSRLDQLLGSPRKRKSANPMENPGEP